MPPVSTPTTALSQYTDAELVRLALQDNPNAFDELVKRHLKAVYNFIYQLIGGNVELAEDLTQETFLRVFRGLKQYQPNRAFKPWLFTIASNVCKSSFRKDKRSPVTLSPIDDTENSLQLENLPDERTTTDTLGDEQMEKTVHNALKQLPASTRQALILRHVYDLSYEEIAGVLQANLNSVRTWLRRGRDKLKDHLIQSGDLDHD